MTERVPKKRFVVQVHNYIDPIQLKKDLAYSSADLTSAMMEQASMFAHYGMLASKASAQVDNMKTLLDIHEAKEARRYRDARTLAGEKTTEPQVAAAVAQSEYTVMLKKALNEARQVESAAKTAVESFRHRRDMLVQHGLISREEMKGELSIAVKNAREEQTKHTQDRLLARRAARAEEGAVE